MLEVKNLSFSYKDNIVLNNISFSVKKGETIGLLGINGSGKSTLQKCLSGILPFKIGDIKINSQSIKTIKKNILSKKISYVSQISSESGLSVFESILLGRKPYYRIIPCKKDLEMVEELIKLMGLDHLMIKDVSLISGGEYQKVIIARAIAQEPCIMLLDEPSNHLDIRNQVEVMSLIKHLVLEHGITSIISIHDFNLAYRYVDRLLILKEGKICFFDKKEYINQEILEKVYGIDIFMKIVDGHKYIFPRNKV